MLDPLVYTSFPASPLMKTHNSAYCDYIFNIWLSRPNFCDGKSYVCQFLAVSPRPKCSNIYQIFIEGLVSEQSTYDMILFIWNSKNCKLTCGDRKQICGCQETRGEEKREWLQRGTRNLQGIIDAFIVLIVWWSHSWLQVPKSLSCTV